MNEYTEMLTVMWNKTTNEVQIIPDDSMSYYDVCGVLSQALDIAAHSIPEPQCQCDHESEETE